MNTLSPPHAPVRLVAPLASPAPLAPLELLELLNLLKLLELSKLLELLKLPKLVLQLLRHTPARASASEQRLLSSRCSLTSSWNHANEACNDPYAELANGAARSTRA